MHSCDRTLFQSLSRPVHFSVMSNRCQIKEFEQRIIGREDSPGLRDLPELSVEVLDLVRRVDHPAQFLRILEICRYLRPVLPLHCGNSKTERAQSVLLFCSFIERTSQTETVCQQGRRNADDGKTASLVGRSS